MKINSVIAPIYSCHFTGKPSLKWITLLVTLWVSSLVCSAQQSPSQRLDFPIVGWTLHLPSGMESISDERYEAYTRKTLEAINSTYGTEETLEGMLPLFTVVEEQYNGINSSVSLHDSTAYGSWRETHAAMKAMLLEVIGQQSDQIQLKDTASSVEVIDGVEFQRFYLSTFYTQNDVTLHTYWYYRKHGRYDFSINVAYVDEKFGKKYLDILRGSTFKK